MFNFCSLYSGSTGNCLLVQTNKSNILIDAGVSQKKINDALSSLNLTLENIDAILITHEHTDHIQSIGSISKKYNIPIYSNIETLNSMPKQKEKIETINQKNFKNNELFELNDLKILPFSIPHDAANPCGFNIFHENKKISIATDIGHINDTLLNYLQKSNFIMLESNYDPEVLKYSPYPYKLKQRIAGNYGHLSNATAGKTITNLVPTGLKKVMLGHLSKENNFPELAYQTVKEELESHKIRENKDIIINVANRNTPSNIIKIV
ncbi:MAG: MBL fold metallo-hydrolase [Clostridia bacterium]|nr:MBL fold metallo-hydrolase [Clostridia bacterium]